MIGGYYIESSTSIGVTNQTQLSWSHVHGMEVVNEDNTVNEVTKQAQEIQPHGLDFVMEANWVVTNHGFNYSSILIKIMQFQ